MKATIREAKVLFGLLLAAGAVALPASLSAQTRQAPPENTPRLMVNTFRAQEKGVGPQAADEVRKRLTSDVPLKNLFVIPKTALCANLEASGFSCDSVPDPITSKLLATQLRADEYLEGTVTKVPQGYRLETRMVLTRDNNMVQPLPPVTGSKLGDLASQVSKEVQAARKQLPDERKCELAVAANQPQQAVAAAQAAIAAYPQSTIGRVCLANAYLKMNMPADSIISVASKVVELDPHNKPALTLLGDAYSTAGNQQKAVQAWSALLAADPKNVRLVQDVTQKIAASGQAAVALPIIVQAVHDNPGDPDLVHLEWLLYLANKQFDSATVVGEEMVRVDTAAADTTFYFRQAAAYAAANQPQKAAETTAKGVAKFPKNADLMSLYSQTLRLAGQTQQAAEAAKKAIALNPKVEHGYLRLAQAQIDLQQPDSAVASLRQAIANGEDKATVGQFLLVLGNNAYKKADSTKPPQIGLFQQAVTILSAADSIAPSPQEKFILGVSAFRVGDMAVRDNQTAKKCDQAKLAESSFLTAQIDIAAGGSVDPKTAQQLLSALQQYAPAVQGQIKKFCK